MFLAYERYLTSSDISARFATITETLCVALISSVMTLIAFLPVLARLAKWFAGAPAGNGRQLVSWIHAHDMDRIFLRELRTEAIIGIYDWERKITQKVVLDIEMAFDNRIPAASDDIALFTVIREQL